MCTLEIVSSFFFFFLSSYLFLVCSFECRSRCTRLVPPLLALIRFGYIMSTSVVPFILARALHVHICVFFSLVLFKFQFLFVVIHSEIFSCDFFFFFWSRSVHRCALLSGCTGLHRAFIVHQIATRFSAWNSNEFYIPLLC